MTKAELRERVAQVWCMSLDKNLDSLEGIFADYFCLAKRLDENANPLLKNLELRIIAIEKMIDNLIDRVQVNDERTNDRLLALESKSSENKPKTPNVPALAYGQIYMPSKDREQAFYTVFLGRDGNMAVKRFPFPKYYRPQDLHWQNLQLVGNVEEIINP